MTPKRKIYISLFVNVVVLLLVVFLTILFRDDHSKYFQYGPSPQLHVISVVVDTWTKYTGVLFVLALVNLCEVIVYELGSPVLGFNVYNPDKKVIEDFTRMELQVLANAMFFISSIRSVFMLVINVTQLDLALFGVIVRETASLFTIRILLNEKEFPLDDDIESCPLKPVGM